MIDRQAFTPVLTAVAVVRAFRRAASELFDWREPPYEYEHVKFPFDISGSDRLRAQVDADVPATEIAAGWEPEVEAFNTIRARYLPSRAIFLY